MVSDPSDVDAALIAVLRNDPELSTLMPGGVYFDVPPSGVTQYVVVQMTFHEDTYVFDGPAFERTLYMVKAVARHTTDGGTKRAAARIQELLHGQTLTIVGYVHSLTSRVGRARDTEPDGVDADARWQHRGAQYEVVVSPVAASTAA
jgi:Protein of unknown function (DUF3168)